jgi:hypothetical protein
MRQWKPVLIPLDRGLGQDSAQTADGVSFNRAVNLDFGKKGAVRGRPGYVRPTGGFWMTGQNNFAPTQTNVANLAATGYTAVEPFAISDKRSERAGLLTNGRMYSYEGNAWVDRFGAGTCRVDRVADYKYSLPGGLPSTFVQLAVGHDFGPGNYDQQTSLLSSEGVSDVTVAGAVQGPGNSAVSGTVTATVHVAIGTNNLIMTLRSAGARSVTAVTIRTDAATPLGYGDNPVICADQGYAGFIVAYKTVGAHTVRVQTYDTSGVIISGDVVTYGTGTITGLWVCNTAAPVKIIAGFVDSATTGVLTRVWDSGLTNQSLDATLFSGLQCWGPVTCGATTLTLGGGVWFMTLGNDGSLRVSKRAVSSASNAGYGSWSGTFYGPSGSSATQGHSWFLQHQPVWVNGRALAGVAVIRAWNNVQGGSQAATWYTVDLTDLISAGSTVGSRRTPVMVARGVLDGSLIPWNPVTATLNADGNSYRFPTVDWTQFSGGTKNPSSLGPVTLSALVGYDGVLGVNEVSFQPPQVDHLGETTVIGGSIPRGIAGGAAYELGFPWLGFPACTAAPSSTGGSWAAGNYSVKACWRWTDDAGQTHRSASSITYNISVSAGQKITFFGSPIQFTDKNLMSPGDRGGVFIEFYMTDVSPTGNAPFYLVATIGGTNGAGETGSMQSTGLIVGPVATDQLPLDTTSIPNLPVCADGGVVTVGRRCWVSDGDFIYASKLGLDGDPPNWNGDQDARSGGVNGPLSMAIPAGAGRILGLASIDERLVALCERGVYIVAGEGPDDTGASTDYTAPLLVSPLGMAGPRSVCSTPRGVVFQSAHQQLSESNRGGLWLIDKSLQTVQVSWVARDAVDTSQAGQLTYIPERGQIAFLAPAIPGNGSYVGGGNAGAQLTITLPYVVIWDLHVNSWTIWTAPPDGLTGICTVAGYLWSAGTDAGGFTALPGTGHDTANGTNTNFTMELQTNNLAAGEDVLGWSRVRSLRVLGDDVSVNHTLTMAYNQDDAIPTNTVLNASKAQNLVVATQTTGWPSDRYAPEWRLPNSKCSTIQVDLQASPAVATWTHLELQVKPERRSLSHYSA